jgi:hypothetical protein
MFPKEGGVGRTAVRFLSNHARGTSTAQKLNDKYLKNYPRDILVAYGPQYVLWKTCGKCADYEIWKLENGTDFPMTQRRYQMFAPLNVASACCTKRTTARFQIMAD